MQYDIKSGFVMGIALALVALAAPIQAYAAGGLPQQIEQLADNVEELSDKIDGLAAVIEGLNTAASEGTPIQLRLDALFREGDINATETILGPMTFTAPEGKSMLIKFASCQAIRGASETHQFDISLRTDFIFESSSGPAALVEFVPTSVWQSTTLGDRAVASTDAHAYLNIPSPAAGAPAIGNVLILQAQRTGTTGTGGVNCRISGLLFPRPAE